MTYYLDILGAALSLLCTCYLVRLNPIGWPIGLAANLLNSKLFLDNTLYADAFVEIYFFLSTAYGWHYWLKIKQQQDPQTVFTLNAKQILGLTLLIPLLCMMIYALLQATDSSTPMLDAIGAAFAIIAQWLLTQRYIENWYLWLASDIVYGAVYFIKCLPFHVGLMAVYLFLGIKGLKHWQNKSNISLAENPSFSIN